MVTYSWRARDINTTNITKCTYGTGFPLKDCEIFEYLYHDGLYKFIWKGSRIIKPVYLVYDDVMEGLKDLL